MPRRIVLYASDHGYGHATRMMALAELLHRHGHRVTLCAGAAAPLAERSLRRLAPPQPLVLQVRLDFGLVPQKNALGVDEMRTAAALGGWLAALPALVARERARLQELAAELVIADVPAAAVAAAAAAGVPAVVCSNFTWLDLYGDRYGAGVAQALSRAYSGAALGLRLGPGRLDLKGVPHQKDLQGLLGRRQRRCRAMVRAELGVAEATPLLGVGLGRSLDPQATADLYRAAARGPALLLVPDDGAVVPESALRFPADTLDAQDYFGACDAVLVKGGYSSIAEVALAGVPLLCFPIQGSAESLVLCLQAAEQGLGVALGSEAEARQALADPMAAISRAHGSHRGAPPDAGEEVLAALAAAGL